MTEPLIWTSHGGELRTQWGRFTAYLTERRDRHSPRPTLDLTLYSDGSQLGKVTELPTLAAALERAEIWREAYPIVTHADDTLCRARPFDCPRHHTYA